MNNKRIAVLFSLLLLPCAMWAESTFLETVVDVLWMFNNLYVRFDTYPYAHNNPYIININFLDDKEIYSETDVVNEDGSYTGRDWHASAESGAYFLPEKGILMNESRAEAMWKFVGITAENDVGGSSSISENLLGNVRVQGVFSLFQFSPISLLVNLGWSGWYGAYQSNSFCLGLTVRSYPVKPLVLEWRPLFEFLPDETVAVTSRLEAGLMLGRCEVYAAWRYSLNRMIPVSGNGVSGGVKYYF